MRLVLLLICILILAGCAPDFDKTGQVKNIDVPDLGWDTVQKDFDTRSTLIRADGYGKVGLAIMVAECADKTCVDEIKTTNDLGTQETIKKLNGKTLTIHTSVNGVLTTWNKGLYVFTVDADEAHQAEAEELIEELTAKY